MGISTLSSALNAATVAACSSLTLQAKKPFYGTLRDASSLGDGTLRAASSVGAFTLRDEALGVVLNASMCITVRGVVVRVERRVPSRGIGAKESVLGDGLSAVLGSFIVMRGMVVGAGGLSVKTSATCTSASCWRGVNSFSRRSLRGSLRILLRSSIVA